MKIIVPFNWCNWCAIAHVILAELYQRNDEEKVGRDYVMF
jgi:AhpD family alkylhydroperoxidase